MSTQNLPKLLAVVHLPPPYHGASTVGKQFVESYLIRQSFKIRYENLATSNSLMSNGIMAIINKIFHFIVLQIKIIVIIIFDRPDVIYITANSSGAAFWKDFLVLMPIKFLSIPHAMHFHNKGFISLDRTRIGRVLLRLFFYNSHAIFLSERLLNDLPNTRSLIRYSICPNGTPQPKPLTSITKINTIPTILFISNMIKEKGVFELLEACSLLVLEGIKFRCELIGKAGDISESELVYKINALGLNNQIHFRGPIYGEDKDLYFKTSDIFVFPTYYRKECFPLVILEAMSFGLPIISTREGGIPDMVSDGKNGYLCSQRDPFSLAEAMRRLLLNADLRTTFGASSLEQYQAKYTQSIFEKKMCDCLLKTLSIS